MRSLCQHTTSLLASIVFNQSSRNDLHTKQSPETNLSEYIESITGRLRLWCIGTGDGEQIVLVWVSNDSGGGVLEPKRGG